MMPELKSIYDVITPFALQALERRQGPDYCAKMMHLIPDALVVDREAFIVGRCQGKHVLNMGCASGQLHSLIGNAASTLTGADRNQPADILMDFDHPSDTCIPGPFDLVVVGEVLEHLANPGNFLEWLGLLHTPVLITVPNAFSKAGYYWNQRGYEQVNRDHVAYYSWWTITNLVKRYGFVIKEVAWYNGVPGTAEGLIVLTD